MQPQPEEIQEIIEYIPDEGEPVLIQGPKPVNTPAAKASQLPPHFQQEQTVSKPKVDRSLTKQSEDLDACYREARDQGIIEDNEVLVRGEWKHPINDPSGSTKNGNYPQEEEGDEDDEDDVMEVDRHVCNFCGKVNVT